MNPLNLIKLFCLFSFFNPFLLNFTFLLLMYDQQQLDLSLHVYGFMISKDIVLLIF